jgi:ABC-type Fe3+/spermidine/putrescine transport system ATPase subunit
MQTAVELRSVTRRLGGRDVLCDIDLQVQRGEFFALIGPSGSGKTTLLKMISGIDTPTQGSVWLGGRDVTADPPYRRPVHTVFQNYALFPHLDVFGNVAFPLRVAGVPRKEQRERVLRALGWVRMDTFAHRRIDNLSGGERQRVALARALVDEPECILLDEPLAALDPHLRGQTLEFLQELQARLGTTYLYVTHDRQEALRAAHRIGVLNHGRLEQVGAPEELYRHPRTAFVAGFAGPVSWLRGDLVSVDGQMLFQLKTGEHVRVARQAMALRRPMMLGVRPEDVRVSGEGFLAVRVEQRQFCGGSFLFRLRTSDGQTLDAEIPDESSVPGVGDEVFITWDPASGMLFDAPESQ